MPHDHAHAAGGPGRLAPQDALAITGRTTVLSVSVAAVLTVAKLAAVAATGSIALLASLADSALDLAAALVTFFAVRYAATPADEEHRFGHGKAEAFAALFQAVLVAVSAALVAREAVTRLFEPRGIEHGLWAVLAMLGSIALTSGLVWVQSRAVAKTGSVAVAGDRAHFASDIAANIVVLAGIGAAMAGLGWADPLVGVAVAAWLAWSAWGVAQGALDQMMDRELPDEERDRICALVLADDRVRGVHQLRTRGSGPLAHMQFHVDLDPGLTLDQAHRIMVDAERRLLEAYPGADVIIHPDPAGLAEPHGNPHLKSG